MAGRLQEAFDAVCKDARAPDGAYVVLVESIPYYGGPEEGGWWGRDTRVVGYQWFGTQAAADSAADRIGLLAKELEADAKREYGLQCRNETDWCDARGLDADYLREPDGHSEFIVRVCEVVPDDSQGARHYE